LIAGALRHDAEQYAKFVQQLPALTRRLAALRREGSRGASGGTSRAAHGFGPRTPLNVGISAERGFAGVSIPLRDIQAIAVAHGAKVNDVVLAICSGALRRYLGRHGGVPEASLIAAMPISLRETGNTEFTTQATMARVPLATDIADPVRRLRAIRDATGVAKSTSGRGRSLLPLDFPTIGLPWIAHGLATLYGRSGLTNVAPPIANVVVSNVPGPPMPLYLAGARVARYWPLSIVQHGLGLNITVESYAGELGFGVTSARNAMRDPRQFAMALLAAHRQLMKRQ
jgi:WS/DGAT/MGAT family acyltransferase